MPPPTGSTAPAYGSTATPTPSAGQQPPISSIQLETRLREAAVTARTPVTIDNTTIISKVEAVGSQILLTATVNNEETNFSDEKRVNIINRICALGPGLVDYSQKMTVAASAMAEKKAIGHRS